MENLMDKLMKEMHKKGFGRLNNKIEILLYGILKELKNMKKIK